MRANYPETQRYLAARKAQHPRLDCIEDYTEWTVLGQPVDGSGARPTLPGRTPAPAKKEEPAPVKKEETMDEYVERRCEEYMHKSLSSRRSVGGKFFTIGGGGDGGCAFQVIG